jgi:hypothetical protein
MELALFVTDFLTGANYSKFLQNAQVLNFRKNLALDLRPDI